MNIYTYTEARQNLASVLDRAARDGEILIKRRDGQVFVVKLQMEATSPLAVEGLDLEMTTEEIVSFIQEGRRV
jgi:phage repressor protein C with HTH and peptisase S24 domain